MIFICSTDILIFEQGFVYFTASQGSNKLNESYKKLYCVLKWILYS